MNERGFEPVWADLPPPAGSERTKPTQESTKRKTGKSPTAPARAVSAERGFVKSGLSPAGRAALASARACHASTEAALQAFRNRRSASGAEGHSARLRKLQEERRAAHLILEAVTHAGERRRALRDYERSYRKLLKALLDVKKGTYGQSHQVKGRNVSGTRRKGKQVRDAGKRQPDEKSLLRRLVAEADEKLAKARPDLPREARQRLAETLAQRALERKRLHRVSNALPKNGSGDTRRRRATFYRGRGQKP